MEMLPISGGLILAAHFCKSRFAKWTFWLSSLPGLLSFAAMLASFALFASLGCTGSILDMHVCKPGATETVRYTIMIPAVLVWLYGTLSAIAVAIIGTIIAIVAEFAKRTDMRR